MALACLWCETTIKPNERVCPHCGLLSPAPDVTPAPKQVRQRRRAGALLVAVLGLPLALSAAYAAQKGATAVITSVKEGSLIGTAAPQSSEPGLAYADPLQRSVWTNGMSAVRQALKQPGYSDFRGSYVNVAAGNVVTFCGEFPGTSGYPSASGEQRFISVFGDAASTALEGSDPSFGVLWGRLCSRDTKSV